MANAEAPMDADIIFRGTDGNECEAFIVAIRDLAFAEGKDEDPNWMLRYATTRLRHKALRWHAKLDPSIRKDWDLFVQALFEEYPLFEERNEGGIATPVWASTTFSPALSVTTLPGNDRLHTAVQPEGEEGLGLAVPPTHGSLPLIGAPIPPPQLNYPLLPGYQVGRVRVLYEEGGTVPYYINCGQPGDSSGQPDMKHVTTNIHEALIVIFTSSSDPHQIVCTNSRGPQTWNLGIQLFPSDVSEFHPLVGACDVTAPFSQNITHGGRRYQIISSIWNVLPDDTLRVTLPELKRVTRQKFLEETWLVPSESYSTTTVYVEIPRRTISFVKDYSATLAFHPSSGRPILRARIAFEPI